MYYVVKKQIFAGFPFVYFIFNTKISTRSTDGREFDNDIDFLKYISSLFSGNFRDLTGTAFRLFKRTIDKINDNVWGRSYIRIAKEINRHIDIRRSIDMAKANLIRLGDERGLAPAQGYAFHIKLKFVGTNADGRPVEQWLSSPFLEDALITDVERMIEDLNDHEIEGRYDEDGDENIQWTLDRNSFDIKINHALTGEIVFGGAQRRYVKPKHVSVYSMKKELSWLENNPGLCLISAIRVGLFKSNNREYMRIAHFFHRNEHLERSHIFSNLPEWPFTTRGIDLNSIPEFLEYVSGLLHFNIVIYLDKLDSDGKQCIWYSTPGIDERFDDHIKLLLDYDPTDYTHMEIWAIKDLYKYRKVQNGHFIREGDKRILDGKMEPLRKRFCKAKRSYGYKPVRWSIYPDETLGYVFFDVETIVNSTNVLETYSIAFLIEYSGYVVNHFLIMDETKENVTADLMESFIKIVEKALPAPTKVVLISYNGSRFDNYMLLTVPRVYNNLNSLFDLKNSGNLVNLEFLDRFSCFDLCKFVLSPLDAAAESFKISVGKKLPYDHNKIQLIYDSLGENEKFIPALDNKIGLDKVKKYNLRDVKILRELFHKVRDKFKDEFKKDILNFLTLGQLAYKRFKDKLKKHDIELTMPSIECDIDIRKSFIGARAQFFDNRNTSRKPDPLILSEPLELLMVDVNSLYPSILWHHPFPVSPPGDLIPINKLSMNDISVEDLHGRRFTDEAIWNVDIKHRDDVMNLIGVRQCDSPINYYCKQEITNIWLTHIDLDTLIRFHGVEAVTFIHGIRFFKEGAFVKNLFRPYLKRLKKMKTEQKILGKAGDSKYDPVLENLVKLLMNILTGKLGQRTTNLFSEIITQYSDYVKAMKVIDTTTAEIIPLFNMGDTEACGSFLLKGDKLIENEPKFPSYLLTYIYSYMRQFLYPFLKEMTIGYTDTDSICGLRNEIEQLQVPMGSEFFQFSYEKEWQIKGLDELNKTRKVWFIGPKIYGMSFMDNRMKVRFKGINIKFDIWIAETEVEKVKKLNISGLREFYLKAVQLNPKKYCLKRKDDTYNCILVEKMFNEFVKNRVVYFVSSQIMKEKPKQYKSLNYCLKGRQIIKKITV